MGVKHIPRYLVQSRGRNGVNARAMGNVKTAGDGHIIIVANNNGLAQIFEVNARALNF